jgi:hypothetical protein
VAKIANPGKTASHHANVFCSETARIDPHVTRSAGTPMPRNDSADSARMAEATLKDAVTSTGASAFGRMWRNMTAALDMPRARAATTKSRPRSLKNSLRMNRATPTQPVRPSIAMTL